MSALKEFADFITLNMANLAATYAQLLAESNAGYEIFPADSRITSARKLLKAVIEAYESQTSDPLVSLFDAHTNENLRRWAEYINPPQPLAEIECLGQTLTPVVTNLEAGKFLWDILLELRTIVYQSIKSKPVSPVRPASHSERKRAEELSLESEERYRLLLDSSPDPIVMYDNKGQAIYINSAFTQTFGWTEAELLGKRVDFVPKENWPETKVALEQLSTEGKVLGFETKRLTKDGRILDVQQSGALIKDKDGKPTGSIIFIRDITELKVAQETAQRQVRREQTIREITEKMRTATTLDELVKTTAEELGERLSAGHTVVQLGIDVNKNT